MYEVGRKPMKSQAYARVICHIAGKERGLSIEALSETELERLADDALRRYPKICDARYRKMAIGRVRVDDLRARVASFSCAVFYPPFVKCLFIVRCDQNKEYSNDVQKQT